MLWFDLSFPWTPTSKLKLEFGRRGKSVLILESLLGEIFMSVDSEFFFIFWSLESFDYRKILFDLTLLFLALSSLVDFKKLLILELDIFALTFQKNSLLLLLWASELPVNAIYYDSLRWFPFETTDPETLNYYVLLAWFRYSKSCYYLLSFYIRTHTKSSANENYKCFSI
jgi:hypothetical protein